MVTVAAPDWLNEDGSLPEGGRLRVQALRVAQCIEAGGPLARHHGRETLIACRRRLGGRACPGLLWVVKRSDDAIHAFCPVCRADEFMIYEWQETDWSDGPMEPVEVEMFDRDPCDLDSKRLDVGPLRSALAELDVGLSIAEMVARIGKGGHPNDVATEVLRTARGAVTRDASERLLKALAGIWSGRGRG